MIGTDRKGTEGMKKFAVFSGFLGSGKTTTMIALTQYYTAHHGKAAMISNDLGEGVTLADDRLARLSGANASQITDECICFCHDVLTERMNRYFDDGCELEAASPIRTVVAEDNSLFIAVKRNLTALDGYQSLLGYQHPQVSGHPASGEPNYAGECFTAEGGPVEFLSWTPNRIRFRCEAPAVFGINQNPGNYWRDAQTGVPFFPDDRDFEPDKTFLAVCTPGEHEIVARPRLDAWGRAVGMAAACLLLAWFLVVRRRGKTTSRTLSSADLPPVKADPS